jgi:CO dehydrogenase maturation factor
VKVAISGQGGTGKTTIAGTLARLLARTGRPVIAIDADSNPNLALTLGIPRDRVASLAALPRTLLEERADAEGKRTVALRLTPAEITREYGIDTPDRVTMLLMGTIDHAGAG